MSAFVDPAAQSPAPAVGGRLGGGDDEWLDRLLLRCRFPDPGGGPHSLAVSGGADSMALMVLARSAGLEGTVIHVDHGLRPGSDADAATVGAGAAELGFAFSSVAVSVGPGPDLEARARRARYKVLPPGVLTGHTMDDQAETVLLNVMRGAGLDGLAGMRPAGAVAVTRPLLGIRRAETAEVCRRAGLRPLRDPSNSDPRFRRNRVRGEVLPLLADVAERDVAAVLARQAALIGEDLSLLDALAADLDPTNVAELRAAHPALTRRALREWLRGGDGFHPPSSAEVTRVLEVLDGRRRACQLAGGRTVARSRGKLHLSPPATAGPEPRPDGARPVDSLGRSAPESDSLA